MLQNKQPTILVLSHSLDRVVSSINPLRTLTLSRQRVFPLTNLYLPSPGLGPGTMWGYKGQEDLDEMPMDLPVLNVENPAILHVTADSVLKTQTIRLPHKRIPPRQAKLRALSATELKSLCSFIDDALWWRIIRKCSSPVTSPILFIEKKNSSL